MRQLCVRESQRERVRCQEIEIGTKTKESNEKRILCVSLHVYVEYLCVMSVFLLSASVVHTHTHTHTQSETSELRFWDTVV